MNSGFESTIELIIDGDDSLHTEGRIQESPNYSS